MALSMNGLELPTSWTTIALAVITVSSIMLMIRRNFMDRREQAAAVAGPIRLPVLGNVVEMQRNFDRLNDWTHSFFNDHVKTFSMDLPAYPRRIKLISTVDPVNVEFILTNIHKFGKGDALKDILADMLGKGIFVTNGDLWKRHRKIASTEFSTRKVREHSDTIFREDAVKLVNVLQLAMAADEAVEFQGLAMRMTLDSICKVAFGVELGGISPSLPDVPFARAFDEAQFLIHTRVVNPFFKLQRALNIGVERRLRAALRNVDLFAMEVISKRREEIAAAHIAGKQFEKNDLLSKFMGHRSGASDSYSDIELRDVIIDFLIAGRDTTAVALSWFVYEMCLHPEIAEKIYEEGVQVLGKHTDFEAMAEQLTHETLSKMHYLHAALSESLRLHPPVPRIAKCAFVDDVLPDGTQVKEGEIVQVLPYSMGRMPCLWGWDALEFKPERWLKDGVFHSVSPFKFIPFQAGPRICLGRDSAYMQMKVALTLITHFFTFQLVPGQEISYVTTLVMPMKNGVKITLSPRQ